MTTDLQLLANIQSRADRITQTHYCTIFSDFVKVTSNDDPGRTYDVRDGVCTCPSYSNYGACKHSLGIAALVDAEVVRLRRLVRVMDGVSFRQAIANGVEIAEAARCEMSLELYRECCRRAEELEAA